MSRIECVVIHPGDPNIFEVRNTIKDRLESSLEQKLRDNYLVAVVDPDGDRKVGLTDKILNILI